LSFSNSLIKRYLGKAQVATLTLSFPRRDALAPCAFEFFKLFNKTLFGQSPSGYANAEFPSAGYPRALRFF